MIKKLSDIYHSDKEYLKVCNFREMCSGYLDIGFMCHFSCIYMHLYVCGQLAKVWLQLIQLKEEEAVDKKELLQLWRQMTQHLSDYVNEEEQDNETQQHVRFTQM